MRTVVLASTSPYRRELLRQLRIPYTCAAPRFKESIVQDVAPELLVKHQAQQKALSLRDDYPAALIIGSDQVFVDARGRTLGKAGTPALAIKQLTAMSGKTHTFFTGLAVVDAATGRCETGFTTFAVTLRTLSESAIADYVARENPVDCAGSFKIEGLGIALMEKLAGDDYTALIGLPLIKLVTLLAEFDYHLLGGSPAS
ncbi:MAG: Maf family protein [Desulfuromonadales bacterium]|nr:Maf family protein [Desulfuromonadales bacterium]